MPRTGLTRLLGTLLVVTFAAYEVASFGEFRGWFQPSLRSRTANIYWVSNWKMYTHKARYHTTVAFEEQCLVDCKHVRKNNAKISSQVHSVIARMQHQKHTSISDVVAVWVEESPGQQNFQHMRQPTIYFIQNGFAHIS